MPLWACEVPFSPSLAASDAPRFGIRRSGFAAFLRLLASPTPAQSVLERPRPSSVRAGAFWPGARSSKSPTSSWRPRRAKAARRLFGEKRAHPSSRTSRAPGACATPRPSSNWSNARASAAVLARGRPSSTSRAGKDDMAPVFGEGGNLPTRFFELDREMLKREGFDFEKFAKKVRDSGSSVVRDSRFDPRAGHAGHLYVRAASTSRSALFYRLRHVRAQVPRALRAHADAAGARRARSRGTQDPLLRGRLHGLGAVERPRRGARPARAAGAPAPGALDAEPRPRLHGAEDDWWYSAETVRAARPRRHGAAV